MASPDYQENFDWQKMYMDAAKGILSSLAHHFTVFNIAPLSKDLKEATDMIASTTDGQDIAIRIRDASVLRYCRDLTIRAWLSNGYNTEIDKLREGYGDYYLYIWVDDDDCKIIDWMFVDLATLREKDLLDRDWEIIKNKGGRTGFIAIPDSELRRAGCILNEMRKGPGLAALPEPIDPPPDTTPLLSLFDLLGDDYDSAIREAAANQFRNSHYNE